MKKFLSLVLALVLSLSLVSFSSAYAVEFLDSAEEETTEVVTEQVAFLLSNEGKVIGIATIKETTKKFTLAGADGRITNIVGNGKVARAKGWSSNAVYEDGEIVNATTVEVVLTITEAGKERGYEGFTANDLVLETIVAKSESQMAHRFLVKDKGVVIATLQIAGTNKVIAIWEADWDGDGDKELCLRAGVAPKSTGGSNNGSSNNNTDTPTGDREDVEHSDNGYSDNPWANTSSNTTTSGGGRQDVTGSGNGFSDSPW